MSDRHWILQTYINYFIHARMRKHVLLMACFSVSTLLMANPVGLEEARGKAASFLGSVTSGKSGAKKAKAFSAELQLTEAAFDNLYVFNNGPDGGFVVVSADDRTDAVLAYSDSGSFADLHRSGALKDMLTYLDGEVAAAAAAPFFTARNDTELQKQDREPIYPLITTCWNQYDPYYHSCPLDPNTGERCAPGCVANTLAQLMYYYQYPAQTTIPIPAYTTFSGIDMPELPPTSFDYGQMQDYYAPDHIDCNYTPAQLEAVQKLLMYAGCALGMEYSSKGSASVFDVERIAKYFGYSSDARMVRAAAYPRATWEEMVYNELAAGRPVPYSAGAALAQNHSFIIDGYDGRGYFHAVTGEIGYYSGNFYCKLHVINDCELQTNQVEFSGYNLYQMAVFGFQPATSDVPLQELPAGIDLEDNPGKIVVDDVHFYNPYAGQKTVAVINHHNEGETLENALFLWMDGRMIGGAGTYVQPGQAGDLVVCIATPSETGSYPIRITSDWEGNNVIHEVTLEVVNQPEERRLTADLTLEGLRGMYYNQADNTFYWDEDWKYDVGIYEKLHVEADITNVSSERYNSWIMAIFSEGIPEEDGHAYSGPGIVSHFYYVDLAPGETKHFSFLFDEHLFKTDKQYCFILDYNKTGDQVLFHSGYRPYFATLPTGINQPQATRDAAPLYNLSGQHVSGDYKGIVVSSGRKYLKK